MTDQDTDPYLALQRPLREMGLLEAGEPVAFMPLTGGVSSDILLVTTATRRFCIKRALTHLKVAQVWTAPVERNFAEAAWLKQVGVWLPAHVPAVLGEAPADGMFAMSYLPPDRHPVWKRELADGNCDASFAAQVGDVLAQVHARSAGNPKIAQQFANDGTFEAIRLDPYFRFTAKRHPQISARLNVLADLTSRTRLALVHGDVSPKNILRGAEGPVFIDAECAWYGDPAFDLAFCLTHLLLKAIWRPAWRAEYVDSFQALAARYLRSVNWEPAGALNERCCALVPALLLARADGKSPVEYLTGADEKDLVRRRAIRLLVNPIESIEALGAAWLRDDHE